jgi:hypothetical protein
VDQRSAEPGRQPDCPTVSGRRLLALVRRTWHPRAVKDMRSSERINLARPTPDTLLSTGPKNGRVVTRTCLLLGFERVPVHGGLLNRWLSRLFRGRPGQQPKLKPMPNTKKNRRVLLEVPRAVSFVCRCDWGRRFSARQRSVSRRHVFGHYRRNSKLAPPGDNFRHASGKIFLAPECPIRT